MFNIGKGKMSGGSYSFSYICALEFSSDNMFRENMLILIIVVLSSLTVTKVKCSLNIYPF